MDYQATENAFRKRQIESASNEELSIHLFNLANKDITNGALQHRDIIRGITINHILMQRHIDSLNKQNAKTEKWVIALAVASLIGTASQIWYAYKADKKSEAPAPPIVVTQPAPVVQLSCPTPVAPQAACPTTKKKP